MNDNHSLESATLATASRPLAIDLDYDNLLQALSVEAPDVGTRRLLGVFLNSLGPRERGKIDIVLDVRCMCEDGSSFASIRDRVSRDGCPGKSFCDLLDDFVDGIFRFSQKLEEDEDCPLPAARHLGFRLVDVLLSSIQAITNYLNAQLKIERATASFKKGSVDILNILGSEIVGSNYL